MDKTRGNSRRTENDLKKNEKEFIISPAEFISTMTKAFLSCDASLIAHHVWWNKIAYLNDVCTEIERLQMILQ
jgi:hypothetical protein